MWAIRRTKSAARRARRPVVVEPLENRRLCSVTVTQGYPGYYTINGDNNANAISVAINQAARTFTFAGTQYTGVLYVTINGYGGNDFITVTGGQGPIGATVNDGDGADSVSVGVSGAIYVGNGQDIVSMQDSFQGEIHTGGGNDQITLKGYSANAIIYAGNGNNLIDASQNNYGTSIYAGSGNNTIYGSNYSDLISVGAGSHGVRRVRK